MAKETGKWIAGIMMIALGIAVYFIGKNLYSVSCSGWSIINPLCWLGVGIDYIGDLLFLGLAIWFVVIGTIIFTLPENKAIWAIFFGIISVLAVINLFVPDPIPLVDELVLFVITGITGSKMIGK